MDLIEASRRQDRADRWRGANPAWSESEADEARRRAVGFFSALIAAAREQNGETPQERP